MSVKMPPWEEGWETVRTCTFFNEKISNNKVEYRDATFAAWTQPKKLGKKLYECFYDNQKNKWRT